MRSLIHRHGVGTVRIAYQTARSDSTADQIETVFVDVFGDGIYDAFDEYVNEEQCSLQAWECSDSVVPVRELPVFVERTTDCTSDPGFVGATAAGDENWYPVQQFSVGLQEDSMVRIDTTDNAVVSTMLCLASCDDLPFDATTFHARNTVGRTVFEVPWSSGRHVVAVSPLDTAQPFSASIAVVE